MNSTSDNGVAVNGTPLTTTITNSVAPGLLRNAIDERITRIRPMATPIDQLSRCAGARACNSMKVNYYSVDVKAVDTTVTAAVNPDYIAEDQNGDVRFTIKTANPSIFSPTETILLPSVHAKLSDNKKGAPMMLYVVGVDSQNGLDVVWVNPVMGKNDEGEDCASFEPIAVGAKVVRMGRAATELDVQTAQFEALPKRKVNNCQIFKMQVEQSTLQKLANKEVGWTFSDQEEVAIIDMRQGMEKNFLFGQQAVYNDPVKHEEVYMTGGIWNQTTKDFNYTRGSMTSANLIEMCRKAFTGASGSTRKILIGGSGLIETLSKMEADKVILSSKTTVKWGIEFKEIRTNFGSLYILHSEIFDQCGHADDGFVLDPDYMTKYCHVPFHTETLNLRSSGQRNTDAIVITEASCLVLRHPDSHMRVIAVA